jgi:hypothetical protein
VLYTKSRNHAKEIRGRGIGTVTGEASDSGDRFDVYNSLRLTMRE